MGNTRCGQVVCGWVTVVVGTSYGLNPAAHLSLYSFLPNLTCRERRFVQ